MIDPHSVDDVRTDMVERRSRLLGPAYRFFYQKPIEVSRGSGVHLWDRHGNEYLDAYNNVVSVGHAHPRVVAAISEQLNTLCTHTRYAQEGILAYAEQLLGTFGGSIGDSGHVMLTCTGSEANDLALRIAKYYTGKQGVIVTADAYHGNSELTASFSPSIGHHLPLGTWVRHIPAPDTYRIPKENMGQWMADEVAMQIQHLERHGNGLAAFVVDSLFSSDGVFSEPYWMAPVAKVVRAAGGLFVADEVQSGFARCGETMWGYQRHALDPDIITMGKPMGNGYPVAGIGVASDVVAAFGHNIGYFNTFGGNTVAVAAAKATLDVILDEGLQANTLRIGKIIEAGLHDIAKRYEHIGDVRGTGLYWGVELVRNRQTKAPDAAMAAKVVNGLRERGVLISTTGVHANVLKMRPPLVFTEANADQLLSALDAVLAQC